MLAEMTENQSRKKLEVNILQVHNRLTDSKI